MLSSEKKALTQADVAKYCGVSRSTVAAVMRNKTEAKMLRDKTRQKVLRAIESLGYRPNMAGATLRGGKKNAVALAIPNMHAIEGPIASKILQGVGKEAACLGYNLLLSIYDETDGKLKTSLSSILRESRIDGVFIYGADSDLDPREYILDRMNCPYVVLDNRDKFAHSLVFDNIAGSQMAVEHLISLGRRRIAMVGYGNKGFGRDRYIGYCKALENAGIELDENLCIPSMSDLFDLGRQAIVQLLDKGCYFDALFCVSEAAAMGCLQRLNETHLKVPTDVAAVAYDDTKISEMATPPLTSVREDGELLGCLAMQKLNALLNGEKVEPKIEIIPVSLTIRKSCGFV